MSTEANSGASQSAITQDDLISKVSINKYDPFQLKGTVDDEIYYVRKNIHAIAV